MYSTITYGIQNISKRYIYIYTSCFVINTERQLCTRSVIKSDLTPIKWRIWFTTIYFYLLRLLFQIEKWKYLPCCCFSRFIGHRCGHTSTLYSLQSLKWNVSVILSDPPSKDGIGSAGFQTVTLKASSIWIMNYIKDIHDFVSLSCLFSFAVSLRKCLATFLFKRTNKK